MQVTVFGASGKVGRQVVALALQRGHRVVAFVHSHDPFEANEKLTIIKGDVGDDEAVGKAVAGSNAVISCLGSWGTKDKDVLSRGMEAIVPALQAVGVSRLVTLTGAGAFWSGDRPSLFDKMSHFMLGLVAPRILRDGETHLRLLDGSSLAWTAVRSPIMRSKCKDSYRLGMKPPALLATIPRPAVAQCLVDQLDRHEYHRRAPFITHF